MLRRFSQQLPKSLENQNILMYFPNKKPAMQVNLVKLIVTLC